MVTIIPQQIKDKVNSYVSVLLKEIPISSVYVFGSHAKGNAYEDSDIDIAVISPEFGKNNHEEGKWLMRKLWEAPYKNIDVVGYSSDEFANGNSPLLNEIHSTGILL